MASIAISTTAAAIMAYGWPAGSRTWQVSNYWCAPDIGTCHTGACHTGPCHTLHCTRGQVQYKKVNSLTINVQSGERREFSSPWPWVIPAAAPWLYFILHISQVHQVQCSAVQCNAVQCSVVVYSAVECSAVQYCPVQCSGKQFQFQSRGTVVCSGFCRGMFAPDQFWRIQLRPVFRLLAIRGLCFVRHISSESEQIREKIQHNSTTLHHFNYFSYLFLTITTHVCISTVTTSGHIHQSTLAPLPDTIDTNQEGEN